MNLNIFKGSSKLFGLFCLMLFCAFSMQGQYFITGPDPIVVGNSGVYSISGSSSGSISNVNWFTSSNGTVNATFGSSASITFNSTSSGSYVDATVTNSFGQTFNLSAYTVSVISVPTPILSAVTQPNCSSSTGTFSITNYSSSNSYTVSPSTGVSRSGSTITAPPGTYRVRASRNGANSSFSSSRTVNSAPAVPSNPILSAVTQPACGSTNGTFSIINYNSAYTYTFTPSAGVSRSGATVSAPQGTYRVVASIPGGCSSANSNSATVGSAPSVPPTPSLSSVSQPSCSSSTGSFTITNYNSAYTYTFTPSSGVSRSGSTVTAPPGTYRVNATISGGCSSANSQSRTVNNAPTVPSNPILGSVTQPSCSNSNGTFTIINYNSNYTYTFTPSSGVSRSGDTVTAPQGTYRVVASIPGGCSSNNSNTASVNSAPNAPPTPTLSSVSQPSCSNTSGSFTITNYNSAYTYTFTPSSGVSRSGSTVTAPSGTYRVRATISGGCSSANSQSRTINNAPNVPSNPILSAVTQPSCSNSNGTFTIINYNSAYTYNFTPSSGVSRSGDIVTAPQGTYRVVASIPGGCGSNNSNPATVNSAPNSPAIPTLSSVSQPSCSSTSGSFTITNYNNSYSYTISPSTGVSRSGNTVTAPAGTYRVQATISGGCTSANSQARTINNPPNAPSNPILSSVSQPSCENPIGTFTIINYNSNYEYTFTPSSGVSRSGNTVSAPQGSYSVIASIPGGCSSSSSNTASVNSPPTVPPTPTLGSATQPSCANPNGNFTITNYNSSYSYIITPSSGVSRSGNTITAPAGTYRVQATISGGCSSANSQSRTINNPPNAPSTPILSGVTQASCGSTTGTFTIINYNDDYDYTFSPSSGVSRSGDTVTAVEGVYSVTASIPGGCTTANSNNATVNAAPPVPPVPTLGNVTQPSCSNPSGSFAITNFNASYEYEISPSFGVSRSNAIITAAPGTYTVKSIIPGGCDSASSQSINISAAQSAPSTPILSNVVHDDCADTSGEFTIINYNANYDYIFTPAVGILRTGNTVVAENGVYTVVASLNGCASPANTKTVENVSSDLPTPVLTGATTPICSTANGSFTISNYNASYSYTVTPSQGVQISGSTITAPAGSYTVRANSGSCTSPSSQSTNIIANSEPCVEDEPDPNITGDNYVYSRTYQKSAQEMQDEYGINQNTNFDFFTSSEAVIQNISYYDAIGRPAQQIGLEQSPSIGGVKKDIVAGVRYDGYGRMAKEWLPVATSTGDFGKAKANLEPIILSYYNKGKYEFTENPYIERAYDYSPINRVTKEAAAGNDWAMGQGHEVEYNYSLNNIGDAVRQFDVTLIEVSNLETITYEPTLNQTTIYNAGELGKNIVYDENHNEGKNHSSEKFVDKEGRVVLKRTYADFNGTTEVEHDTYYVYDNFGNLTYILPPKINLADGVSQTELDNLAYQYTYDDRNRLVVKKTPGKGKEFFIYNSLDQLIMTQDANQRLKDEWLFTKYDAFGREAYSGKAIDTRSRTEIQSEVNGLVTQLWVEQNNTFSTIGGAPIYYNDGAFPQETGTSTILTEVLAINYYDSYVERPSGAPLTVQLLGTNNGLINTDKVKGLPTGSRVKVLDVSGSEVWINSLTYYDEKARPIYTYTHNEYLGTIDIMEIQLDFIGRVIKNKSTHIRNGNTLIIIDNFVYDHVGRLLSQTQCVGDSNMGDNCDNGIGEGVPNILSLDGTINTNEVAKTRIIVSPIATISPGSILRIDPNSTGNSNEELIVFNKYDELGQLESKKVGGVSGSNYDNTPGLQTVDYSYNIRGWLTGINDLDDTDSTLTFDADKLFAYRIGYNEGLGGLYNGNISLTQWHTLNQDQSIKQYDYSYDPLNRIVSATDNTGKFSISDISYDKNGNIENLKRNGWTNESPSLINNTGFGVMDDLTYFYQPSSNRLSKVADAAINDQYGFKDDAINGASDGNDDFLYDENGNMIRDDNKEITGILYNYLDLPTEMTFSNGTIKYVYAADGRKLKKIVSATNSETEYADGYIYTGNTLQFFPHPEGYVSVENQNYNYVYNYKDHLGNVRLTYTDNNGTLEVVEESNYYPFGLRHRGYNDNISSFGNSIAEKFKFNGQEFEDAMELNINEMDFRQYEPSLGRFYNPDRLAENAPSRTPYRFAFNNPVYWSDPSGLYEIDEDGNIVVTNENGNGEVAKLLEFLKGNQNASVDDIAEQIVSSGDFAFDLAGVTVTANSPSSRYLAISNFTNQVQSGLDGISNFNGNINFTKDDRTLAEWGWDNKHQLSVTAGAAFNAYAGVNEVIAGFGMMAAPTGVTQVTGGYAVLDGFVRIGSAPLQIWGTWTGNTSLENSPGNLVGTIGFLIDSGVEGDWKTGGRAQVTMELMGDFGISRKNLVKLASNGFRNPNKWKNVINIGNATYQIIRPYKDAIQLKNDGKL